MSEQRKRISRPGVFERMELAWSTGRHVDGIWIGSWRTPEDLRRIEAALLLIKQHSRIHYSRVIHNLARVWVRVLLGPRAEYDDPLKACVLDERYVSSASLESLAATIVHETTHARLARCGFEYKEGMRSRIDASAIGESWISRPSCRIAQTCSTRSRAPSSGVVPIQKVTPTNGFVNAKGRE